MISIDVTDSIVAAQVFAFFTAGFETSSTTLSFCLYELAFHESIQKRVFLEVSSVATKNGKLFNYESLKDMVLLERCILGELHSDQLFNDNKINVPIVRYTGTSVLQKL